MPDYGKNEPYRSLTLLGRMPKFKSHKIVGAGKIRSVTGIEEIQQSFDSDEKKQVAAGYDLALDFGTHGFTWRMPTEWVHHFKPEIGQMLVVYDDGYASVSPADKFDAGYTRIDSTNTKAGPAAP